jgi:hypothetical protein
MEQSAAKWVTASEFKPRRRDKNLHCLDFVELVRITWANGQRIELSKGAE